MLAAHVMTELTRNIIVNTFDPLFVPELCTIWNKLTRNYQTGAFFPVSLFKMGMGNQENEVESRCLTVHPRYGAIYREGEFVQRGAILGLALDAKGVVIAPISGWVRLQQLRRCETTPDGIHLEIWRAPRTNSKRRDAPLQGRLPA